MHDSPRHRLQRHPNRTNRPHAGQSVDPTLTRKGVFAHPGSLLVGAGALVFFSYVFNVGGLQAWLDGLFGGLDTAARSRNGQVSRWVTAALPYVGVALVAVGLFFALSGLGRSARTIARRRRLRKRGEVSLQAFIEAAAQHGVGKRVAREAYQLLLPHYEKKMRVTLVDRMTSTLRMTPGEVSDLYGNLLRNSDRQGRVGDTASRIETVLDLLEAAERSAPRSLTHSRMHERVQAPVRRRPSLGQTVKESLMRSEVRKPRAEAAAPAQPMASGAAKDVSMIKPYRLEKKESEMQPKAGAPESQAS